MGVSRVALLVFAIAFFAVAMLRPTLRVRRRTGIWALTFHRGADPFQRLIGVAFGLAALGVPLWIALYVLRGPQALGVWGVPAWVVWMGWALMLLGFALTVMAQNQMGASWRIGIDDRPTTLVTDGLFAWVRNPIFSGMLLLLAGLVLISPCAWSLMGGLGVLLLISLQTRLEEQHLLALHGEGYRDYASRVGRFLPGVGRLRESDAPSAQGRGDG